MPAGTNAVALHSISTSVSHARLLTRYLKSYRWTLLLVVTVLLSMPATPQSKVLLPDMGDSAGKYISPQEEEALGRGVLRTLRQRGLLVDDPQLVGYVESLGRRVLSGVPATSYPYTFFLVRDGSINAFAAPGGYIGIHAGLILASETEDELAGVVAHEIAHVQQRHAARAFEAARKFSFAQAAAMIAGLLVGVADPSAGAATLYAGMAGSQQMALNFTRENEYEADRVGIGFLASAGFDPEGMSSFFGKLMQKEGRNSLQIEYLRTHPVNSARIAEAQARANDLTREGNQVLPDYDLAVARLRMLLSASDPVEVNRLIETSARADLRRTPAPQRYALALALRQSGKFDEALSVYDQLLVDDPHNAWYRLGRNEVLRDLGRLQTALDDYEQLRALYPGHYPVQMHYIQALLEAGKAEQASALARIAAAEHPDRPQIYHLLGEALARSGDHQGSLEALAEYFLMQGQLQEALRQLDQALEVSEIDHISRQRIEERREQIRALAQAE
jgi:predicted Zn-dependent protease